ncbi:peptidylprolyl isomerase [Silicimonas sp. MF1-12-2]|uniref:peptidylprolyl isomerase n=1 Tax=Silicimonas sp. MF1-12-2 TaxID=3384793 RepID=UPI0039B3CC30
MRQSRILECLIGAVLAASIFAASQPAQAQSRFSPAIKVGDSIVTRYELDQRTRFLSLLGAPGDPRNLAREQLINEAVQLSAASDAGIETSAEEIEAGMEEFAGRANLTAEEFVAALGQNGVDSETFRDFIGAGVAWRSFVRQTLGETAQEIPRDLVRRTLAQTGTEGGLRVLVSEILLPATTPETAAASRARAAQISALTSEEAFSAAARELSVAASSASGGALNWVALDTLPDMIQPVIAGLTPGQISRPIELENAIGVFLLRKVERVDPGATNDLAVDYALFITDGTPGAAERVAQEVDVCDDLYGIARGLPEERLVRDLQPLGALPADIRAEVTQLDQNEVSTRIIRNGAPAVLMLCERKPARESSVDLEIVGNRLLNTRLGTMAADRLADLRANTIITDIAN